MPGSTNPPAATSLPDIFPPLQLLLTLLSVGNRALLSRPEDPLPRALAQLTTFGKADIDCIMAITDSAGLYELLQENLELFADYLLLGQLAFASPLGPGLAAYLVKGGEAGADEVARQRVELLAYVAHYAPMQSKIFEDCLLSCCDEADRAEAARERAAFRASVAAAFAEWQHSLGALILPPPAPVLPPDEDERQRSIRPQEAELGMLRLAVVSLRLLPSLSTSPFADALQHLPDFHPQRLEELEAYLNAAVANEQLPLSRQQCLLLYVAAHVTVLALLSDVLDGEGFDDLLLGRQKQENFTSEMVSLMREHTTRLLAAFIALIREHEGDTSDFQALEARLAPVLALGAG